MIKRDELDPELLSLVLNCQRDPWIAREIEVKAVSIWSYKEWTLYEFQQTLSDAINNIPNQDRNSALVILTSDGSDYDSGQLKITYRRLETEDEVVRRVARHVEHARAALAAERATFEKLKQKYGSS